MVTDDGGRRGPHFGLRVRRRIGFVGAREHAQVIIAVSETHDAGQSELRAQNRSLKPGAEDPADWRSTRDSDGDRRMFMTRQVTDSLPMVPGPEEEQ